MTMPRPVLLGHPVRGAALGMLLVMAVGALPQQIRWADGVGGAPGPATEVRLLTVSPTMLYGDRTGMSALLHEAWWAVLFLGVLLAMSWGTARVARARARPFVLCVALVTFAPVANLAALALINVSRIGDQPIRRGESLNGLLLDAQSGAAHAVVIAVAGACVVYVSHAAYLRAHLDARASPAQASARHVLEMLRGPSSTLWRRIGAGIGLAACAGVSLRLLTSDAVREALTPFARPACAVSTIPDVCTERLATTVFQTLPGYTPVLDPLAFTYARLYAFQAFLVLFALTYVLLRAAPGVTRHPLMTMLAVWHSYTWGAVAYAVVLGQAVVLGASSGTTPADHLALIVSPRGLTHALLAAPAVAVVLAAVTWASQRLRARARPA